MQKNFVQRLWTWLFKRPKSGGNCQFCWDCGRWEVYGDRDPTSGMDCSYCNRNPDARGGMGYGMVCGGCEQFVYEPNGVFMSGDSSDCPRCDT
jgi:hypothetical protein